MSHLTVTQPGDHRHQQAESPGSIRQRPSPMQRRDGDGDGDGVGDGGGDGVGVVENRDGFV